MNNSDNSEEKLAPCIVTRQMKPFIDHNLQLQLPSVETLVHPNNRSHSPIYSHYMGSHPSISSLMPQVNEEEFHQAMNNAEQAYAAWSKMRDQMKQRLSKY